MQFYISHLIEDSTFLNLLDHYSLGIESIHFSVSDVLDQGIHSISPYVDTLMPYIQQRPLILHGPFFDLSPASFDSQIKAVTFNRFNLAYDIAKKLGAKKLIFHTGFIPQIYYTEGWLQNSILFWKEFMTDKDHAITICIENVFENEYAPILELLTKVNHPAFKFCLDVGHVNAYSSFSLNTWTKALGHYLSHIHVHNNHGNEDAHLGLENGTLELTLFLKVVHECYPDTTLTLEIYNVDELTHSLDYLALHHYIKPVS